MICKFTVPSGQACAGCLSQATQAAAAPVSDPVAREGWPAGLFENAQTQFTAKEAVRAGETTNQGIPAPEGEADIIDTEYEIGQENFETQIGPFGVDIHNPMFLISGLVIVAFVFYALALPEQAASVYNWLRPAVTAGFDWFFFGAADFMVLFCLFLIVSPWGSVRLGSAGGCTPGRSTPSSHWHWRCSPITRGCRFPSAQPSIRSSVNGSGVEPAM